MVVRSPDEVLWRWLELREQLANPSARITVAEKGLVFPEKCPVCKALGVDARREDYDDVRKVSRWLCAKCEETGRVTVWPVDVAFLLRNEFDHTPVPDGAAELYATMATYGKILSGLSLREQRIYLLLYLYENVGAYDQVAVEASRRWPRSRPPTGSRGHRPDRWSEWTVRRCIIDARRRINDELRVRGMKPRALG